MNATSRPAPAPQNPRRLKNGHEDPARPRRVEEAPALLDRRRRQPRARDGRFIEKLGTYDPLLPKDNEGRVKLDPERARYWLGQGAQATDRVQRFLEAAGLVENTAREPQARPARQGRAGAGQGPRREGCGRGSAGG